jgi:hypothetical protein
MQILLKHVRHLKWKLQYAVVKDIASTLTELDARVSKEQWLNIECDLKAKGCSLWEIKEEVKKKKKRNFRGAGRKMFNSWTRKKENLELGLISVHQP